MNNSNGVVVLGYHGTIVASAVEIVARRNFKHSENPYDWLGNGAYFFQDAPLRAWLWAKREARRRGSQPAVVAAEIHLGRCLDLLDIKWSHFVRFYHHAMRESFLRDGKQLPIQRARVVRTEPRPELLIEDAESTSTEKDVGRNRLDRHVFNFTVERLREDRSMIIDSVRAGFSEGYPLYDTSFLCDRSHIQIAVRDTAKCIIGDLRRLDIDQLESERNDVNSKLSRELIDIAALKKT